VSEQRREDRKSSRCLEDGETPQPIFGVVLADHGAPSDLATAQPPRLEFFVDLGSTGTVDLRKLLNAESPLSGTTPPFSFWNFRSLPGTPLPFSFWNCFLVSWAISPP
jgi:hypothetical protein